jgi:hypothetical protein
MPARGGAGRKNRQSAVGSRQSGGKSTGCGGEAAGRNEKSIHGEAARDRLDPAEGAGDRTIASSLCSPVERKAAMIPTTEKTAATSLQGPPGRPNQETATPPPMPKAMPA